MAGINDFNLNEMEPDVLAFFQDLGLESEEEILNVIKLTMDAFDIPDYDSLYDCMSEEIDIENLEEDTEEEEVEILNYIRRVVGE